MTHSKRRRTVNGRMTEPYSASEYGPRRVSATLHTKLDRADTIDESPGLAGGSVVRPSYRRGEQHGPGMRSRLTVVRATTACGLLAVATISHRRPRRCR